jgi:hypothetical protein
MNPSCSETSHHPYPAVLTGRWARRHYLTVLVCFALPTLMPMPILALRALEGCACASDGVLKPEMRRPLPRPH